MKMIALNILFFGSLKTYFGNHQLIEIPHGSSVKDLLLHLKQNVPEAGEILTSCQVAVNSMLEKDDYLLIDCHEIAILPPFSGG